MVIIEGIDMIQITKIDIQTPLTSVYMCERRLNLLTCVDLSGHFCVIDLGNGFIRLITLPAIGQHRWTSTVQPILTSHNGKFEP